MLIDVLPLFAAMPLLLAGAAGFTGRAFRPRIAPVLAEVAALAALAVAIAAVGVLVLRGAGSSPMFGIAGSGFSARLDAVSATMLTLVSFVGWILARLVHGLADGVHDL